jgi:uncharacterized protein (DUF885 family)
MKLVGKIVGGLFAFLLLAVAVLYVVFWWKPIGLDNYVNKVSIEQLIQTPESLTSLGLIDNTLLDFHSGKLDDYTEAADARVLAMSKRQRAGLDKYGPANLKGQETLTWPVLADALDEFIRNGESRIPQRPYRINQLSGVTIDEPQFLTDMHQVSSKKSAENYVKRVTDFGRVLREVKARVEKDRADGISPPDFIIDQTLVTMRSFIEGGPAKNTLVATLGPKLDKVKGLSDADKQKLIADATSAVEKQVIPGYQALIELFVDMRKTAPHDAGVWRLPGGDKFYAGRLKSETTTDLTADQIHEIGLSEVARIEAAMTAILDARKVPPGVVGERIDILMKDPAEGFSDDDAGRTRLLDYLNSLRAAFDAKATQYFKTLPKSKLEIVRVPEYQQDASPGGYYSPAALDGSRPGRFYINLKSTKDYPRFTLPTLFFHEAEPGHHFQLSAAHEVKNVPIIRQVITPTAYAEGWGLYAEQLAKEMGLYDNDPLGDLGRLQSEMFRAVRLVVDTGMHSKKWSREEAIAYMRAKTGMTEAEVTREIERYAAWPGQACAYKVGELTILRLREKAKTALGAKFDIRDFHEEVLMNGGLPLPVLEKVIDDWIAEKKSAA